MPLPDARAFTRRTRCGHDGNVPCSNAGVNTRKIQELLWRRQMLALMIEDYDHRNALPPDMATPDARLRFLLEHSGKPLAGLLPIFGQRSHVNEALKGKRKIGAGQARKLAKMFNVNPGLFI